MRADVVILLEPRVDHNLCLSRCGKPLSVQHLPAQRAIETLVVTVLPRRTRIDPDGLNAEAPISVVWILSQILSTFYRFQGGTGLVTELCRSFESILCSKGDLLWDDPKVKNFDKKRFALR